MDITPMVTYEVQLVLKNKFGEFIGKKAYISKEQYDGLIKMSKTFYSAGGFELTCEDESYAIFPPNIVEESILIINKKTITGDESVEEGDKNVQE
jgi:hypothetical protein